MGFGGRLRFAGQGLQSLASPARGWVIAAGEKTVRREPEVRWDWSWRLWMTKGL